MGKSKKRSRDDESEDTSDGSGSSSSSSSESSRKHRKDKKHKKDKKKHKKSHKRSGSQEGGAETARAMEKRLLREAKKFLKKQKGKEEPPTLQLEMASAKPVAAAGESGWAGWNRPQAATHDVAESADAEMERQEAERGAGGRSSKAARKREKEELDELVPKATGKEARAEARIGRREEAKARDASPELTTLPGGGDIMGGGAGDSFKAALARQRKADAWRNQRQAAKSNVMQERLSAFQQAEDAKMAAFRSLIASAGGGFAIPKRDGA